MTAILGHLGIGSLVGGNVGRLLITSLLFGASVATVITASTGAIFSDTQSVGANTFSTGTVTISSSPASAIVSLSAMAPGDKVASPVTVSNDGSLPSTTPSRAPPQRLPWRRSWTCRSRPASPPAATPDSTPKAYPSTARAVATGASA